MVDPETRCPEKLALFRHLRCQSRYVSMFNAPTTRQQKDCGLNWAGIDLKRLLRRIEVTRRLNVFCGDTEERLVHCYFSIAFAFRHGFGGWWQKMPAPLMLIVMQVSSGRSCSVKGGKMNGRGQGLVAIHSLAGWRKNGWMEPNIGVPEGKAFILLLLLQCHCSFAVRGDGIYIQSTTRSSLANPPGWKRIEISFEWSIHSFKEWSEWVAHGMNE